MRDFSRRALRKIFEQGQRLGFDVLPRHFYSEIPEIRELKTSSYWKAPFSLIGVNGSDIQSQLSFVGECCPPPIVDRLRSQSIHASAIRMNGEGGFGVIEADFLYAVVATRRPKQIFQIGCGVSTAVCLLAAEHAGYTPDITCIEPYPTKFLIHAADHGKISLIKLKAQMVDYKMIDDLDRNVLFFVDSTHTLGPAGEASRIILEMLPRLKTGAIVHFHDILFPYDYVRRTLDRTLFFPHESVLLHAFLVNNSKFRILASLSMLHYSSPQLLVEYLPNYQPDANDEGLSKGQGHFPSSTYLEAGMFS